MSMTAPRRIVAGLDANGKSCVVSDGPVDVSGSPPGSASPTSGPAGWPRPTTPRRWSRASPRFGLEQLAEPVYAMMVAEYAPGLGRDNPHLHFTNTADHFYVIEGEVVLVLESGDVTMKAGDIGVCRGVMHGWRNDSDKVARLVTFVLPAAPLG
jgi:quercetin dioxygenase-like cupin family protein